MNADLFKEFKRLCSALIVIAIDGIILTLTWNAIAWQFNLPTFSIFTGMGAIWVIRTLKEKKGGI